ncbi:MAG: polysaccharide pyruvyl transferase family protein [Gordonia sp. (in: high G+C Gram-positive bacteria)]
MTGPKVVLCNVWHDDNKGDSAIAIGTVRLVRHVWPDAQITVVGLTEEKSPARGSMRHLDRAAPGLTLRGSVLPTELRGRRRAFPVVDVPVWLARLAPHVVRAARGRLDDDLAELFSGCDLAIGVGGSNLYIDRSVSPAVSLARLFTVARPLSAAARAGVPTVLLGHTLGPFPSERKTSWRIARRLLSDVGAVVVRDGTSVGVAEALGVDAELAPDLAYAARSQAPAPTPAGRQVVVALRQHPSEPAAAAGRLIGEIADAVQTLRDAGLVDSVLVVAHTLGPTPIEDDRAISRTAARIFAERGLPTAYNEADRSPEGLIDLYATGAAMIAVRLHAAILAMTSGTPTFTVSYFSTKARGVMTDAGVGECVGEYTDVVARDIVGALTPLLEDGFSRARLAKHSEANAAHLRARATSWFTGAHQTDHSQGDS